METCSFTNKANSHSPKEEIHTRSKLCRFGLYVVIATLFCLKSFVPVTGLECSYGKIFIPVTEMSVAKTEILTGPESGYDRSSHSSLHSPCSLSVLTLRASAASFQMPSLDMLCNLDYLKHVSTTNFFTVDLDF